VIIILPTVIMVWLFFGKLL